MKYIGPVDDYVFLLHDYLRIQDYSSYPGFEELTPDTTRHILTEAASFHQELTHPVNRKSDEESAQLHDGQVRTPTAYKSILTAYQEAGWLKMAIRSEIGGMGLPPVMSVPVGEFGVATAHSFRMYTSFCAPVSEMLSRLGEPWMKQHVVPRLVETEWTATMAMTESHCGTDLRQLRTKARQSPDGTWRLDGTKVFISGGDHDLCDNIIHIVLAKVPDANGDIPNDISAVSVFLVSKRLINTETGALGDLNGVFVDSVEHKMGIAGNATCVLRFDDAVAYRLSGPGAMGNAANMAPMFFLMNYARVGTAMLGVGYGEIAAQYAADYARERLSGRAPDGTANPAAVADPIVVHPDIRRLLLSSRAFVEGGRALGLKVAFLQSVASNAASESDRVEAADIIDLMTPVMKAYFTDKGFEATNACLQVLGGHGYIAESGLEQFVRNSRIGQIYEGTNGIQAIDLVRRKLPGNSGRARRAYFGALTKFIASTADVPGMSFLLGPLKEAVRLLEVTIERLDSGHGADPNAVFTAAYDVLTMFGIVSIGWAWAEMSAVILTGDAKNISNAQARRKLNLARLWFEREMPLLTALAARTSAPSKTLMALEAELV
ncbi:MAG: acyl-CoA dehydrogenase [Alphaproteobacteria bacterium]|nr:acyl-CoA dehydrogenase [Alphaproteobacteria bacterium]